MVFSFSIVQAECKCVCVKVLTFVSNKWFMHTELEANQILIVAVAFLYESDLCFFQFHNNKMFPMFSILR